MRVLPEEERVQRAVGEGIGRAMRDLYDRQETESVPDFLIGLLKRLDRPERRPA
jgi:hypothetical protein